MHERKGTYIILLNYRGWRDSIACLDSLLPDIAAGARVVLCDNLSADGSLEHISDWARQRCPSEPAQHPRLRRLQQHSLPRPTVQRLTRADAESGRAIPGPQLLLVDNAANGGFAAGNNVGLRFALAQPDMTHVWILNNDTLVEPDCLSRMHARLAAHKKPGVCGSMIHFFDNPEVIQCIGGNRFNPDNGRALQSEGRYLREDAAPDVRALEQRLAYLSGCSMLLPRAFLEEVGLMNEDYFLYYEEIDWFTRAGGRFDLLIAEDAHLYHREGGSIGSRSWKRGPSLLADLHMFRSRVHYMRQHHPGKLGRCNLHNWLDVARRLLRGQWKNAYVISRVLLTPATGSQVFS